MARSAGRFDGLSPRTHEGVGISGDELWILLVRYHGVVDGRKGSKPCGQVTRHCKDDVTSRQQIFEPKSCGHVRHLLVGWL